MLPTMVEQGMVMGLFGDIKEGLRYLRTQPRVRAIGLTYAFMMAGVLSANVLVVALARDIVHAGARGYGYIESGWAVGAVAGGFAPGGGKRRRPRGGLVAALALLPAGHPPLPHLALLAA